MAEYPNDREKIEEGAKLCGDCPDNAVPAAQTEAAIPAAPTDAKKRVAPKRMLLFGVIAAAALAVVFLLIYFFAGGTNGGVYLKNGSIVYRSGALGRETKLAPYQPRNEGTSVYSLAQEADDIGKQIVFADGGNRIFYPSRLGKTGYFTLCCRDLDRPWKQPIEIDSDVAFYAVNDAGTQVVYQKGYHKTLFLSDLSKRKEIAKKTQRVWVADDLKKILYWNSGESLNIWRADSETVQVAADVEWISHVSEDLSTVYYMKGNVFYKYTSQNDETETIASDVSRILKIYDSGEIYFVREHSDKILFAELVEDDLAEYDATVTEPKPPEYPEYPIEPNREMYQTEKEYNAALDRHWKNIEAYELACRQMDRDYREDWLIYEKKCSRDQIRKELRQMTLNDDQTLLYYYDGKEETLLTDSLSLQGTYTFAADRPMIVVQTAEWEDISALRPIKLSELDKAEVVQLLITEDLDFTESFAIAIGSEWNDLNSRPCPTTFLTSDGNAFYCLEAFFDFPHKLYRYPIKDGQIGERELVDRDIGSILYLTENDACVYYKNLTRGSEAGSFGDLFVDGVEVDKNTFPRYLSHRGETTVYFTDWDNESTRGTLKMFRNGKVTKIADGVSQAAISADGTIRYLADFDNASITGSAWRYRDGKSEKIADGVTALVPICDEPVAG